MDSNQQSIVVSIISALSAIVIAYIVNIAAKRVQKKKEKEGPTDRYEQMFDGYERLIKQKDVEDDRKARLMAELEQELILTRDMVKKLEATLESTKVELEKSRAEARELRENLRFMRREYQELKDKESKEVK